MKNDRNKSVAFTGYRTEKIIKSLKNPTLINQIYFELYSTIKTLNNQGFKIFLSGMSEGFDLIAAEAVLVLRNEGYDVKLIAVIPFMGQESEYSRADRLRYRKILDLADELVFVSDSYHDKSLLDRNDYLIENSSMVVCYYSRLCGETTYTYNQAKKTNLIIINIFGMLSELQCNYNKLIEIP